MPQAIRTTIMEPTATKGARIRAQAAAGTIIIPYKSELSNVKNHRAAAMEFIWIREWVGEGYGTLVSGCLADGSYCHVLTGRDGTGDCF